jgi:membrane protein implicated in regulation of membrane protease activity
VGMDDWLLWLTAAGLMAVGETLTLSFFLGPVAVAALVASGVALAGGALALQWIVFILVAASSVAVLRPVARRHLHTPAKLRTGVAALVGKPAVVLERVDANGGPVKLGGEIWTARAYDEDRVMEPGTRVEVLKIDGATALVSD